MSSGANRVERTQHTYTIRRYEPGDRSGFLDLYDRVFGDVDGGDRKWFAWKFEDNPYYPDVPMFVAESNGEIVGTRPFLAFPMRVGDRTHVAFQTCDTMVHPDHRRRGVFTRMTRQAFEYYADREPAFTFNVPNELSRPGYLSLGCEVVSELSTYYRVQNPAAFVGSDGVVGSLARLSDPLARGYLGTKDTLAEVPPSVSVTRHVDVPADTLASLYSNGLPDAIHANRDEEFLEYRFENPTWDYTAYTARTGGDPVAGIVTATRTVGGTTVTNLADVVPLVGDDDRDRGLVGIVSAVLDDHAGADVVAGRGPSLPTGLLRSFGFHSDRSLPLSLVSTPTILIASPLPVDGEWTVGGFDLRSSSSWMPTFVEQNTS